MKFVTFQKGETTAVGIVEGDEVVDLSAAAAHLPGTLKELIEMGEEGLKEALDSLDWAAEGTRLPLKEVDLLMPVLNPGKTICIGLNYVLHAKEGGHDIPEYPGLFMRGTTSLCGPGEAMIKPKVSDKFDYECELMVVVGKRGRGISKENALDHIFGYTCFNDGSVRDYQRKGVQWTSGKNFDSTGAVGPWVVTLDELPAGASGLRIQTRLNGEVLQDSNTDDMIFPVPEAIEILSEFATLEPGDLIAFGTPSGVGFARKPAVWMKDGDVVEIEIEGIGVLRNPIANET